MTLDKLNKIKKKLVEIESYKKKSKVVNKHSDLSVGFKISMDLISPIIACILIGLGIDKFFYTKPIFFIIFLLLGICTGFFNTYKFVKKIK